MNENNISLQADAVTNRLCKTLLYNFFVLLKTARNYEYGHSAMNSPVSKILTILKELKSKKEDTAIKLKGGYLFVGEHRLKPDKSAIEPFTFTMGEMNRYFIGAINFDNNVTAADIGKFAYIFGEIEPLPSPQTFEKFDEKLEEMGVNSITVEVLSEKKGVAGENADDNKERAKLLYAKTINAVSEVMENVKIGQTLKLKKSKRVIQSMIDQMLTAETNLIGLTTIRCHDEYTYHHSVNVCILSLGIGQRIGLKKATLCDLGLAALFHDIGKSDIPLQILNKPAAFNDEEWAVMKTHPLHGVKELMKLKGLDTLSARIITGAFEHHLNLNHSGYPKIAYKREISLFGRIIAIADCYDGITSSRVYSRNPMTPDKALKFMTDRAGEIYDPVLLKLFINCVGVYPIGSLILLTSRELAVVMESNPVPDKWDSPVIKLISDAAGNEIEGPQIDLAHENEKRKIAKTLDPELYHIDVSRYFL